MRSLIAVLAIALVGCGAESPEDNLPLLAGEFIAHMTALDSRADGRTPVAIGESITRDARLSRAGDIWTLIFSQALVGRYRDGALRLVFDWTFDACNAVYREATLRPTAAGWDGELESSTETCDGWSWTRWSINLDSRL